MRLKYWTLVLLCLLTAGGCSDGELEGDLYPVSPDQGGNGNNSQVINGLLESMVRIPGGTFLMGNENSWAEADESPAHLVTLSSFCISKYEVPQQLWTEIMGSNPSAVKWAGPIGVTPYYDYDFPVTNVSYDDCLEFIRKLNERTGKVFALPTEAQWELAARDKYAGAYSDDDAKGNKGPNGSIAEIASSSSSSNFGVYQMGGNVWEWCADWYGDYSTGSQKDPTGPKTGKYRIFRGGSFASVRDKCRVTYRASNLPTTKGDDLGFRLVMQGFIDLQVSQEKLDFKRKGGTQTVTVTTEKSWSYDVSASWCRVSKSDTELTVITDENRGKTRKAVITITAGEDVMEIPVEQDGETFEILYQNEHIDTLRATHSGGEATLAVQSSSSVGWTVLSGDNNWCHVNKSGSSIRVTVDPYTVTYRDRETYVLLSSTDRLMTDTLWIVQKRMINLELRLNGDSEPVEYLSAKATGGSRVIDVRTNANWFTVVSGNDSWCHVVEKTLNSFKINVDALSGIKERQTFVAVDAEGIRDTIWVSQDNGWVGEYYNQNGVQGIIYEVSGDGKSGKIVSLTESSNLWSSKTSNLNGTTGATSLSDGESNMNTIRNISGGWPSYYYPAFNACNQQGAGWYLPAMYELIDMFAAVRAYGASKFDQALSENGGQVFSSAPVRYWSSTEYTYQWARGVDRQGMEYNTLEKNSNNRVRAIRKVTFD